MKDSDQEDEIIGLAYELGQQAVQIQTEEDLQRVLQTLKSLEKALSEEVEALAPFLNEGEWQQALRKRAEQLKSGDSSSPGAQLIQSANNLLENSVRTYRQRTSDLQELGELIEAIDLVRPLLLYQTRSAKEIDTNQIIREACRGLAQKLGAGLETGE